ncbi:hypothetical protein PTNB73_04977 [Pyrenophora teres f. teres]|nr:hypothetical protein PTNB73_04977 [Pyrenophora teres f. teres]
MPTAAAGSPNRTNTRKRNTAIAPDETSPICSQESNTAPKDYNTISSSEQNTTITSAQQHQQQEQKNNSLSRSTAQPARNASPLP